MRFLPTLAAIAALATTTASAASNVNLALVPETLDGDAESADMDDFVLGGLRGELGEKLTSEFGLFDDQPLTTTDAVSAGWVRGSSSCDDNLGIAYNYKDSAPTKKRPVSLYYTATGAIAGVGIRVYGSLPSNLISRGFWVKQSDGAYLLTVSFRPTSAMCGTTTSPGTIGNQLMVNQGTLNVPIPLTDSAAQAGGFTKGGCIDKMGTHWALDLESAPKMTWEVANLMPVIPMYNDGVVSAFFIASDDTQQSLLPPSNRFWDIVVIPRSLMCLNWCDDSCSWKGTLAFSTMHWLLGNYESVSCSSRC